MMGLTLVVVIPATGSVMPFAGYNGGEETLTENQAGFALTPMMVDQQIFQQPVQAYFQFVQNNLNVMNESNIDLFRQEAEERHTQIMEQWFNSCSSSTKVMPGNWSRLVYMS